MARISKKNMLKSVYNRLETIDLIILDYLNDWGNNHSNCIAIDDKDKKMSPIYPILEKLMTLDLVEDTAIHKDLRCSYYNTTVKGTEVLDIYLDQEIFNCRETARDKLHATKYINLNPSWNPRNLQTLHEIPNPDKDSR